MTDPRDTPENPEVTSAGYREPETQEEIDDVLESLFADAEAELDAMPGDEDGTAAPQGNHRTIKPSANVGSDFDALERELLTPASPEEIARQLDERGISRRRFNPGRLPLYYRTEVERIKADPRPHSIMAEVEGVSLNTIMKVRSAGKFEGVPYIARDEIDREAQAIGHQPTMKELLRNTRMDQAHRGHPFKGRARMDGDTRKAIAFHPAEAKDVAEKYGVSTAYVYRARRDFNVRYINRDPLTPSQREKFEAFKDRKSVDELAGVLNLPPLVVSALLDTDQRGGIAVPTDEQVTLEGNAHSSGDDDE